MYEQALNETKKKKAKKVQGQRKGPKNQWACFLEEAKKNLILEAKDILKVPRKYPARRKIKILIKDADRRCPAAAK